jgi:hypothetical protein
LRAKRGNPSFRCKPGWRYTNPRRERPVTSLSVMAGLVPAIYRGGGQGDF